MQNVMIGRLARTVVLLAVLTGAAGAAGAQNRPQPGQPTEPTAADYARAGNQAYNRGNYPQAVREYERSLEKKKSADVYLNLGHANLRLQRWDRALKAYARATPAEAMRWMAQCHVEKNRLAEAVRALTFHLMCDPSDDEARLQRANIERRLQRHAAAAAAYRDLLKRRPTDVALYRALAGETVLLGKRREAVDLLEIAWRLGARSEDLAREIGDLYLNLEMPSEAARFYERFLRVAKKPGPEDYFRAGYTYLTAGEMVSAKKYFEEAVKLDPSHARSYVYLGDVARKKGDVATAEKRYRRALQADPKLSSAHAALGEIHFERRAFGDAATGYEAAIQGGESGIAVHYNLVLSLDRSGKRAEAVGALKRALRAHPRNAQLTGLVAALAGY